MVTMIDSSVPPSGTFMLITRLLAIGVHSARTRQSINSNSYKNLNSRLLDINSTQSNTKPVWTVHGRVRNLYSGLTVAQSVIGQKVLLA
jgi:hypothetical protein